MILTQVLTGGVAHFRVEDATVGKAVCQTVSTQQSSSKATPSMRPWPHREHQHCGAVGFV